MHPNDKLIIDRCRRLLKQVVRVFNNEPRLDKLNVIYHLCDILVRERAMNCKERTLINTNVKSKAWRILVKDFNKHCPMLEKMVNCISNDTCIGKKDCFEIFCSVVHNTNIEIQRIPIAKTLNRKEHAYSYS